MIFSNVKILDMLPFPWVDFSVFLSTLRFNLFEGRTIERAQGSFISSFGLLWINKDVKLFF